MLVKKLLIIISVVLMPYFSMGKLNVVATNTVLYDWVKEVGGNEVEVVNLVPFDTDNHTFEPTPRNVVSLSRADIVFRFGFGLEGWLDRLMDSVGGQAKWVELSESVKSPIREGCHHCNKGHDIDPHTWLSVMNAKAMVKRIGEVLIESDEKNANYYLERTERYIGKLDELDKWIRGEVGKVPKGHRVLITSHNSLAYYARDYGFRVLGSVLHSTSTEHADPSAKHISHLVKVIKERGVPAIFSESIHNPDLIREVAKEAGLAEPRGLYTGALSGESGPASTYIKLMRYNTEVIVYSLL